MKNRVAIKILTLLIIFIIVVLGTMPKVYGSRDYFEDINNPEEIIDEYKKYQEGIEDPANNPDSWRPSSPNESSKVTEIVGDVLGAINIFGIITSVIVLMIIGIKYMVGSVEEKAEYKKVCQAYIIGAILVFSCTTIPNILYKVTTDSIFQQQKFVDYDNNDNEELF